MPFLHPPTFRNLLRQASFPQDRSIPTADLDGRILLLGVLTLTARYHQVLVAHHSQLNDPLTASEYYTTAHKTAFGRMDWRFSSSSLDNIQALLMLGLYEWGQTRGLSAWMYVGIAIRLAQAIGLAYEDECEYQSSRTFSALVKDSCKAATNALPASLRKDVIGKEVRRRTYWSCFIMDHMLSAGRYRPTMISSEKLRVKPPCSDGQFLFAHNSEVGFLSSDWVEDDASVEVENTAVIDDGVLSRYVRLIEIFGRFSEWSFAGGRRTEKLPPWDPSTKFFKLRQELEDFYTALPSNLTLSEANLSAYIEQRNATTYASMHTLHSLCLIMLHREYIPFIPLRCQGPRGPLDEPTFPEEKYDIPEGFWEASAKRIFKAARDIIDIVRTCLDNNALPESPQIGFAVWQAAFVSLYAVHFQHMDQGRYLLGPPERPGQMSKDSRNGGYIGASANILREMVPRLRIADGYLEMIGKMDTYFIGLKNDFNDRSKRKHLGLVGGGLEQYKTLEKELKEFGSLEDTERIPPSAGSNTFDHSRSRAGTNNTRLSSSVNGKPMQGIERTPATPNRAWASINTTSPFSEEEDRPKFNQRHCSCPCSHQHSLNYQQSPDQPFNPPCFIALSNGDCTPDLSSPYANTQGQPYDSSCQPQLVIPYPSIDQHIQAAMLLPNMHAGMQGWMTDEEYESFISYQEVI